MFAPVKVLIVDDQAGIRESLQVLFELHGLESLTASTPDEALDLVAGEDIGVVVQDMNFTQHDTTGESGVALFRALRSLDADLPIVVLTAWGSFETAVQLVKEGASDYMEKPWDEEKLVRIVQKLLHLRGLQQENIRFRAQSARMRRTLAARYDLCGLIYASAQMQNVVSLAATVATSDVPVLITGPNGAGKEKLAEIIQANSRRKDRRLRQGQRGRPARPAAGGGALRRGGGGVHGVDQAAGRTLRSSRRWDAVPGRDRQLVGGWPGQAAPRASDGRIRAAGLQRHPKGRRSHRERDERGPVARHRRREHSARISSSVSTSSSCTSRSSPTARTTSCRSRSTSSRPCLAKTAAPVSTLGEPRASGPGAVRMARERAGAPEPDPASDAPLRRRPDHPGPPRAGRGEHSRAPGRSDPAARPSAPGLGAAAAPMRRPKERASPQPTPIER